MHGVCSAHCLHIQVAELTERLQRANAMVAQLSAEQQRGAAASGGAGGAGEAARVRQDYENRMGAMVKEYGWVAQIAAVDSVNLPMVNCAERTGSLAKEYRWVEHGTG